MPSSQFTYLPRLSTLRGRELTWPTCLAVWRITQPVTSHGPTKVRGYIAPPCVACMTTPDLKTRQYHWPLSACNSALCPVL